MKINIQSAFWRDAFAVTLAIGCVVVLFVWQGHVGFSLWDEGYLWYGAQRVIAGEVPIRDFQSYDPGRYYWVAWFMSQWGDTGIMALRRAVAVFQALGLVLALILLIRNSKKFDPVLWLLAVVTLSVWMFPRHKLFDISLSIGLIGVLTSFIQYATLRRAFLAGLCVGLVAVFGRNHGIYGVVGSLGAMIYLAIHPQGRPDSLKLFAGWSIGVATGYLPMLLMLALIPGFSLAFWESVRLLLEQKATNLPVPIPWPWIAPFGKATLLESTRAILVGLFFVGIVAFAALGTIWAIRERIKNRPVPALLIASIVLALPYSHYAYSRADLGHLAQGSFPFLIGVFVALAMMPSGKGKWSAAALIAVASSIIALPMHPGYQYRGSQGWVTTLISGDFLAVDPVTAEDIALLRAMANQYALPGSTFIAAPFWPGAYALLGRKSPTWEIYANLPRSPQFERAEIKRIIDASPRFAIVLDLPLDGREDLRFRNTRPLIYGYILENFERLENKKKNLGLEIYARKKGTGQVKW